MSEWERKMKKDVWSSLYWPFRVFCCCICQQTISKPLIPSSSLSLRDISILASFDGSENAVGIRWKFHPSIFFLVRGLKKGSYTRCPRIFLPHNVVNDESGEIGWGWRKGQIYINNFHIFLASFSFICIFFFQFIFQYFFKYWWKKRLWIICPKKYNNYGKKKSLTDGRKLSHKIWRNSVKYFLQIFQLTL